MIYSDTIFLWYLHFLFTNISFICLYNFCVYFYNLFNFIIWTEPSLFSHPFSYINLTFQPEVLIYAPIITSRWQLCEHYFVTNHHAIQLKATKINYHASYVSDILLLNPGTLKLNLWLTVKFAILFLFLTSWSRICNLGALRILQPNNKFF